MVCAFGVYWHYPNLEQMIAWILLSTVVGLMCCGSEMFVVEQRNNDVENPPPYNPENISANSSNV